MFVTRDILIVVALDAVLILIAACYIGLTGQSWVAQASPQIAVFAVLVGLACTAVAGMLINRLPVGVAGIAALWGVFVGLDLATSSASFSGVASQAIICFAVQLVVFIAAWWLAHQVAAYRQ